MKFLTCVFCGAQHLQARLIGADQYLALPTHADPETPTLTCPKSGSMFNYLKLELGQTYTVVLKYPAPKEVKGFDGPAIALASAAQNGRN